MNDLTPKLQEHLAWAMKKQREYYSEIQKLNEEIANRRDLVMKYQGIIEYLRDTQGIQVPQPEVKEIEEEKDE